MSESVTPQPVLAPLTEAAIFLVLTIDPHSAAELSARGVLADVAALTRSVGFRSPEGELTCVVGIGSRLWDRLFGAPRPAGLRPFRELVGAKHTAASTPGDLLFHIRAHRMDLCFELAGLLVNRLAGSAQVADEVHGFRYFDQRDLMGFVDGTENPGGAAAVAAVTIGDEDQYFTGGSYVIVQKYLHDLEAWNALPIEDQERVVGRTKLSDIELPDDLKPADSHVRAQHDHRRERRATPDRTGEHAVRQRGQRAVRDLLHRLREQSGHHRADAGEHVPRQATRQPRPNPRLLDRDHGHFVLRAKRRLSR